MGIKAGKKSRGWHLLGPHKGQKGVKFDEFRPSVLTILYVYLKSKMAALASDFLTHFQVLLKNHCIKSKNTFYVEHLLDM